MLGILNLPASERDDPPLFERERELALIAGVINDAAAGSGGLAMLEGDPGMGKSALLERAGTLASAAGLKPLPARGGLFERTTGFGVAQQLLEATTSRASPPERERLFEGAAGLAGPLLGLDVTSLPIEPTQARHGLYWLLANLAEEQGPLALLLDDAHWCDRPTLDWLLYVLRRIEGLPIAIVMAAGRGEPDAPGQALDALAAETGGEFARLSPLSPAGTSALLDAIHEGPVAEDFARACHAWTGGNPSFISEVAAELAAEGVPLGPVATRRLSSLAPGRISALTLTRLGRLPEGAQRLAGALAILGFDATLPEAGALADLAEADAIEAADALVDARFIRRTPRLSFVEPLIGRVIYNDLAPTRRAADHGRAARLLHDRGATGAAVAGQLLRADPAGDPWTVERLLEAAGVQLAAGSGVAAVPLLRRALEEPPGAGERAVTLTMLGLAELTAGEARGLESLRSALAASAGPGARGNAALLLARFLVFAGLSREAVEVVKGVLPELGEDEAALALQLEAALITAARADVGMREIADRHLGRVREAASEDSHAGRSVAVQCAYSATAEGSSCAEALSFARSALAGRRLLDEAPLSPDVYLVPISMLALCDELDEADEHYREALARARSSASPLVYASTAALLSRTAGLRGELAEAELLARDALRIASESPALEAISGFATVHLAIALIERGESDGALELLGSGLNSAADSPHTWTRESQFAAGMALLAQRRPAEALERLSDAGRLSESFGILNPAFLPWRSGAAQALHDLGREDEALALSTIEVDLARRFGASRPLGVALRVHGLILGGEPGLELLHESSEVLATSPARLDRARSLVSLGAALRRAGRRADAREPLAEGLRLAEACGAEPLAKLAREELGAGGVRRRAAGRWDAGALTISELRTCRMAAEGLSNPAIAQALFVTRGTVESHLHSAYRKLGITSRNALSDALSGYEEGPGESQAFRS